MEKKLYELEIDEEFRDALPSLSEEQYSSLEESIVSRGCDIPLVVWKGMVVDGHARYEICHRHGIPFAYNEMEFKSREDALMSLIEMQINRRSLTPFARCEVVYRHKDAVSSEAAKRRGCRTDLCNKGDSDKVENFPPSQKFGKTREFLGAMADVSDRNYSKAEKLIEQADEEVKKLLRKGEISIHKAYTDLFYNKNEAGSSGKGQDFSEESKGKSEADVLTHGQGIDIEQEEPSPQGSKIKHIQGPYAAQKESQDSLTEEADNTETPPSFKASKPVRPEDMIDMSPFPGYEGVMPSELTETHEEIESFGGVPNEDPRMKAIGQFHMIKGEVKRHFDRIMDAITCLDENSATEENLETLEELVNVNYEEILKEIRRRKDS